jgi:hypothetical protein
VRDPYRLRNGSLELFLDRRDLSLALETRQQIPNAVRDRCKLRDA